MREGKKRKWMEILLLVAVLTGTLVILFIFAAMTAQQEEFACTANNLKYQAANPLTTVENNEVVRIAIDEVNFPDEHFRKRVLSYDTDGDNMLSEAEIASVTFMDIGYREIADLTGIEYFTCLTALYCYNNQLTSLDVSQNTNLKVLYCDGNQLTTLDVSRNTALTTLYCRYNQLTSLDLSENTALTTLYCDSNSYIIGRLACNGFFDLKDLPVFFDTDKADNWSGAECKDSILKDFTGNGMVTYTYDMGNNRSETFTLIYSIFHNFVDGRCTDCGYRHENHTGGKATCKEKPVCEVCGMEYGELLEHTDVTDEAVAPNCIETGLTEGKHCLVCGEVLAAQEIVPATGIHNYVNGICPVCKAAKMLERDGLTYTVLVTTDHTLQVGVKATGVRTARVEIPSTIAIDGETYTVTTIAENAFKDADGITEVVLPDTIVTIENGAFENAGITKIEIPYTVAAIGNSAFKNCNNLFSVTFAGVTAPVIGLDAFLGVPMNLEIIVPTGSSGYMGNSAFDGLIVTDHPVHSLLRIPKVDATCTTDGKKEYWICTGCDMIFADAEGKIEVTNPVDLVIERSEHDLVKTDRVEASCNNFGLEAHWICSVCKNYYSDAEGMHIVEDIASLIIPISEMHTPGITVKENEVKATCTINGFYDEVVYCTVCGKKLSTTLKIIEAAGHIWDDGEVTKEPTAIETGTKTYMCVVCGTTKTEDIAANPTNPEQPDTSEEGDGDDGDNEAGEVGKTDKVDEADKGDKTDTDVKADEDVKANMDDEADTEDEDDDDEEEEEEDEREELEVGDILTDPKSGADYEIIKLQAGGGSVKYLGANSDAKMIKIPEMITVDDLTYKVISIAAGAFENNKKVIKITMGSNVTSIAQDAFSGCSKLTSVMIGKNVTKIGARAFYKCTKLNQIIIPSKVSSIGKNAFQGCKSIKKITIKTTKLTSSKVGSNAFKDIYAKVTIRVPKSRLKNYRKFLKTKGLGGKAKIKK